MEKIFKKIKKNLKINQILKFNFYGKIFKI